ncbi:MAG: acetylxylan esterase [Bryobacterales bacterium]|nr:acetylxylan esterase [Bryobacterales bacterium]
MFPRLPILRIVFLIAMAKAGMGATSPGLTLDGRIDDPFWETSPPQRLIPVETGVPSALGGEVWGAFRGGYLCLAAKLPEPGGKILAWSIGRNPVWAKDLPNEPELEDRVVFKLQYAGSRGKQRTVTLAINPWGAYRIENGSGTLPDEIARVAQVDAEGWTVEAALSPETLGIDMRTPGSVSISAERVRPRRALAPQFRWTAGFSASPGTGTAPAPEIGRQPVADGEEPYEVGRVDQVPPVAAGWSDSAWASVPEFTLARNEPSPRAARYPTRVKWVHDGRNLAIAFRAEEPEPLKANANGRDSVGSGEDHVAAYLAISGSSYLEIALSATGALRDALGQGPRSMRPNTGWNGPIESRTDIRHGYWTARLNIPLEQCAAALGENAMPRQWRILLSRYRASRPGEASESSTLPVLQGASSFYGPARYHPLLLGAGAPEQTPTPKPGANALPAEGLAAEISRLPSEVWSPFDRRRMNIRTMLPRDSLRRAEAAVLAERRAWEKVKTREDWERFRDQRMAGLRESLGVFPPAAPPLDVRVGGRHAGKGYRLENLVYQSRSGYYVTANLYLPERILKPVPVIVLIHSHHYPKTEWELQDSGVVWARAGAAVLVMERPGFGERTETNPWYRMAYASRFVFQQQLALVGESLSAWTAWDVHRTVDYLSGRPEIDSKRIILLGAVASGGEVAALSAALDPRVAAAIPYNYDQGHVRVHGDSAGQLAKQFSPWLVAASMAPRKFVRPFEFAWESSEEPAFENLWVDGMSRSEFVWKLYGAGDSLACAQGFGLLRAPQQRRSPCENVGPEQRESLFPILQRWFGIPFPSAEDRAIPPSSLLSTNPDREAAIRSEAARLRPASDLMSITPAVWAELSRRSLHEVAFGMGSGLLREARERAKLIDAPARAQRLRDELRAMLGDIEPLADAPAETIWRREIGLAAAEAIAVRVEEGIQVPMLLLTPAGTPRGVAVAIASGGKDRFLKGRPKEIAALLNQGIAVCLPDLRGLGETDSDDQEYPYGGLVQQEFDLDRNLLGSRLRDLRTVLASLRARPDLAQARIVLWGESFSAPNPPNLWLDEVELEAGPRIQRRSDPQGAVLALLAGLYENDVKAVAARGSLTGYLSVLANAYSYTPSDVVVRGILKAGDIADIAGALAPRPLMLSGLVGGRNILASQAERDAALTPAREAFRASHADQLLRIEAEGDVVSWFIDKLQ